MLLVLQIKFAWLLMFPTIPDEKRIRLPGDQNRAAEEGLQLPSTKPICRHEGFDVTDVPARRKSRVHLTTSYGDI